MAAEPELAQRVRSILSNRCFACHGPDEAERQGGFRLDDPTSFLGEADSGEVPVVPRQPEESELLRRVLSEEEYDRMPPPEFGPGLETAEIEVLRAWIEQGAELPQHWSFVPPQRPDIPELKKHSRDGAGSASAHFHPVDRFVLSKLEELELQLSPEARRAELLRRLSLDLIGLPPTLEELRAFERDGRPGAYERQVDRLLASPAFGEHWARKWLDLARYADSAGYADDPPRTIWAYRDWVIKAINDNLPVDQFTEQQIAGDLLPDAIDEQLVATAFHRNTLTNNEGGTNDEEFRNVAVVDRVNTTMAVWMGVTMACAQCHTHKYDPFTQEEYFRLFAIFNQSADADRKDESPTIDLFTLEQQQQQRRWEERRATIDKELSNPTAEVLAEVPAWEASLTQAAEADAPGAEPGDRRVIEPAWTPLMPTALSSTSKSDFTVDSDQRIRVEPTGNNIVTDTYSLGFRVDPTTSTSLKNIQAIGVRTLPTDTLPRAGAGLGKGNFVLTNVSAKVRTLSEKPLQARFVRVELPGKNKILSLAEVEVFGPTPDQNLALSGTASQSSTDYEGDAARAIDGNTSGNFDDASTTHTAQRDKPWWEVDLGASHEVSRVVVWNRTGGGIYTRLNGARVRLLDDARQPVVEYVMERAPETHQEIPLEEVRTIRFRAAYAGYAQPEFPAAAVVDGVKDSGWAVGGRLADSHLLTLILADPLELTAPAELELSLEHNSSHRHHLLGSFRVEASGEPIVEQWAMLRVEERRILEKPAEQRTEDEQTRLVRFYSRHVASQNATLRSERAELERKLATMQPATSVPVMRELEPKFKRETHVQIRGNYKALGKRVEPGTPQVFHPLENQLEQGAAPDRRALATWLVDRKNPLTARVWVNRLWESLFGIGIVRTSEEFGSQGDRPSHPELLDWLACELMESDWDTKRLLRLLVTSGTYRQSSEVTREALALDKDNIWLARGPRVRLSAEMVRDQALSIAGLLSSKMHGPPVRPPQPDLGLKAAFGSDTDWQASDGEDRYRRGLYTTWRRSSPYPSMATFDAPSREVCTLRRDSTNTPLQALVTLNDPAFVEAAQGLARRIVYDHAGLSSDEERLRQAFLICASREPTDRELEPLAELLSAAREHFAADADAARQLATEPLGALPTGKTVSSQEEAWRDVASWTAVSNVLLNLDEVLMKR